MNPDHPCFHFDMGHVHMSSAFHIGYCENVLFDTWKIRSVGTLIASMFGVVAMGILLEAIKAYREKLYSQDSTKNTSIFSASHMMQTSLHLVHVVLSYFLMLIAMYYNTWLFLSVIVGATIGYFAFGWQKIVLHQPECKNTQCSENQQEMENRF